MRKTIPEEHLRTPARAQPFGHWMPPENLPKTTSRLPDFGKENAIGSGQSFLALICPGRQTGPAAERALHL